MKLYMKGRTNTYNAVAEYDIKTKKIAVLKGSILSTNIQQSNTFKGYNRIQQLRQGKTKNNILQENIEFNSLSTAANFVSGNSSNGLITWKDENGTKIKDIIKQ